PPPRAEIRWMLSSRVSTFLSFSEYSTFPGCNCRCLYDRYRQLAVCQMRVIEVSYNCLGTHSSSEFNESAPCTTRPPQLSTRSADLFLRSAVRSYRQEKPRT